MELLIDRLLGFGLVLTRTSAFMLILPIFGAMHIPVTIKVAITVICAAFFTAVHPFGIDTGQIEGLQAVLLLCNEAVYGLALGLVISMMFIVIQVAGRIIERQMGLAMGSIMDPLSGENVEPLGMIYEMIFILLFLAANGHHLFFLILSNSYELWPVGTMPGIEIMTSGVLQAGATMLVAALRLSAPLVAAFLLLMVVLAILARVVPEMNILFISLPVKIGFGLVLATMVLPFISGYVSIFADWMSILVPI